MRTAEAGRGKMKLTIECTEEQAQLLVNCLEEAFRFRMKQENLFLEHILLETYPEKGKSGENFEKAKWKWYEVRESAQTVCKALMNIIYGKYTTECLKSTHEISDMWRVIRHELYMFDHDGKDFWDVRSDKPIQLSDMPLIKCEVEE